MILFLVVVLVMTSVFALVYGMASLAPARSRLISKRLGELQSGAARNYTSVQRRQRQEKRERLEALMQIFGERVTARRADWSRIQQTLLQAGYRRPGAVAAYFGTRLVTMVLAGAAAVFGILALGFSPAAVILGGSISATLGWLAPQYHVKRRIRKRQLSLQRALPDTLDLLVVCVEAGLGLNQALVRVSDEIEHVSQTMSDELVLTNLEIRAGTPRDEALRNLGDRTGLGDLKSLTAMLVQTDRFGTSIATALRVHSDTMRTKRRQRAEEAAAKTTIKLVFPLVLFIFPAMFVVILGPAVLHILEQMEGLM
ncbi:MAG TPA: type II secretion system F family protein [Gemmatimonadota bacterium]|nr:type II secretion system F family protein [Gemmatimonadota bacterium]